MAEFSNRTLFRAWMGGKKAIFFIAGAIVTFISSAYLYEYTNRPQTVSYYVSTSDGQIKVEMPDHKLTVMVDGKPVDNLSTVHVVAYNTSNIPIENGTLTIRFKPTKSDSNISDKLRSVTYQMFPDQMTPSPTDPAALPNYLTKSYTISHAVSKDKCFEGNFVFSTSAAPDVELDIKSGNLKTERVDAVQQQPVDAAGRFLGGIFLGVTVGVMAFLAADAFRSRPDEQYRSLYRERLRLERRLLSHFEDEKTEREKLLAKHPDVFKEDEVTSSLKLTTPPSQI